MHMIQNYALDSKKRQLTFWIEENEKKNSVEKLHWQTSWDSGYTLALTSCSNSMNQSWHSSPVSYLNGLTFKLHSNVKQSKSIFKEQDVCALKLERAACFAGPAHNLSRSKSVTSRRVC